MTTNDPPAPSRAAPPSWALAIFAAAVFLLFSWSFSGLPALERAVGSVVGETDVGAYVIIYREFTLGGKLGDEYRIEGRGNRDMAEKHRIHHVVAAAAGRAITAVTTPPLRWLGIDPARAAFLVSPLFVVFNIFLLARLLTATNPHGNPVWPFLLFYVASLATWLYGSMPDSWPVTSTFLLLLLVALRKPTMSPYLVATAVGLVMLNNMAISSFAGLIWLRLWQDGFRGVRLAAHVVGVFATAIVVWLVSLLGLSLIDPVFRPDHVMAYSVWFRDLVGATLPLTDPYVWKAIIAGLYLNSIVANPVDPNVHVEALRDTIERGGLGLIALIAAVLLLGLTAFRWVQQVRRSRGEGVAWMTLLTRPAEWPLAFAAGMAVVTLALFYPGGFTYAVLVIPCLALVMGRLLDLRRPLDRVIMSAALVLIVANNLTQVLSYREHLRRMEVAAVATQRHIPATADPMALAIEPAATAAPRSLK